MTVRKIIELIEFVKENIGNNHYSGLLQDYIVTIQNNPNNLVLLKELNIKAIEDYEKLIINEIPELLDKVLVSQETSFMNDEFYNRLVSLEEQNHTDPSTLYNQLNAILTQMKAKVSSNITELDKIITIVQPFLSKDYSELQKEDNAIFSIIFNNESSFNNLKALSFELKNWDRALHIYQQIISNETPKPFDIVEVDQGSIEVVITLLFEVGEKLLELFKVGLEVYAAYLAYKTVIHDSLIKSYRGNPQLVKSEVEREKLLLDNIRLAVKDELKKQSKKIKKHEALEKKMEEVTKLVTEHIIKGNSVKLLSAPEGKEEIFEKEAEKEEFYMNSKIDFKKLDNEAKQLLISQFTTQAPNETYE